MNFTLWANISKPVRYGSNSLHIIQKWESLHIFHWLQIRRDLPTYIAELISLLYLTSVIQNAHIYSAGATILILAKKSGCLWAFSYWFSLDKIFVYVNLKPSITSEMCYTSGIKHEPNSSRRKQLLQRRSWARTHKNKSCQNPAATLIPKYISPYIYMY